MKKNRKGEYETVGYGPVIVFFFGLGWFLYSLLGGGLWMRFFSF